MHFFLRLTPGDRTDSLFRNVGKQLPKDVAKNAGTAKASITLRREPEYSQVTEYPLHCTVNVLQNYFIRGNLLKPTRNL